jgi:predicted alpha/beta hydrolase
VRQLRDWKGSADIARMVPKAMRAYGELCGWTLARAHARTGDRLAIAAYLGSGTAFDAAVREFAVAYADQTERDHAALVDAIADGRVTARADL